MSTIIISPQTSSHPADNALRPLAVSVREAARLLSVSERSIRLWTKEGKLHARKLGGRVLYSLASLESLLASDSGADSENGTNK